MWRRLFQLPRFTYTPRSARPFAALGVCCAGGSALYFLFYLKQRQQHRQLEGAMDPRRKLRLVKETSSSSPSGLPFWGSLWTTTAASPSLPSETQQLSSSSSFQPHQPHHRQCGSSLNCPNCAGNGSTTSSDSPSFSISSSSSTSSTSSTHHRHPMNFISDAVEPVLDSVVNITVEVDHSSMFTKKNLVSTGSGFVIGSDGTILTNAHVVSDMCEGGKLTVTASDGVKFTGFIASIDPLSDLAIVKILPGENESDNANVHRVWPVVKFMSSKDSELRPGDWVVAIGSPFGLQNTVTAGIVSSRSRKNTEIGGSRDGRVEYIQTDCAVHSGSSGGPLINLNSEVVGINTSRAESEAISFAIRVDNAIGIIQQMAATGKVVRPWLGIKRQGEQRVIEALQTILTLKKNEGLRMVGLSANVWQQLRMQGPLDCFPPTEKGVLVTSVFPGSPAELAGLLQGDVITSVKTARVDNTQEVYSIVGHKIGHPVEFTIARRVPLDVDWDGRISNYEDQVKTLYIRPAELLEEQLLESPDFLA